MTRASSHRTDFRPRLHYLQWNPSGRTNVVLLHGNSANAWWWEPVAREMPSEFRLLALDQRGHGDSEWVRPAAYTPADYARDLVGFLRHVVGADHRPILVGHSMGGLSTLALRRIMEAWRERRSFSMPRLPRVAAATGSCA